VHCEEIGEGLIGEFLKVLHANRKLIEPSITDSSMRHGDALSGGVRLVRGGAKPLQAVLASAFAKKSASLAAAVRPLSPPSPATPAAARC
jgi:hypothetical protein